MIYPLRWQNVIKKQVLFLNGSCHVCLGHVGKSEKLARLTFAKQQDAIEWLTIAEKMTGEKATMDAPQIYVERTLAIVKPDAIHKSEEIEDIILRSGFAILQVK